MPSPRIALRARAKLASLVAPVLLAGCYRYVPAASVAPPAGADVRLYLTPQGMTTLEPRLGPQTTTVLGRVSDVTDGGLTLLVSETRKADGGSPVRWIGERVTIPAAAVARTEHRALDRRRSVMTGLAVTLAAIGAFALLAAASGGRGSDDPGTGPGPTP